MENMIGDQGRTKRDLVVGDRISIQLAGLNDSTAYQYNTNLQPQGSDKCEEEERLTEVRRSQLKGNNT